jgi:hypothetical protein
MLKRLVFFFIVVLAAGFAAPVLAKNQVAALNAQSLESLIFAPGAQRLHDGLITVPTRLCTTDGQPVAGGDGTLYVLENGGISCNRACLNTCESGCIQAGSQCYDRAHAGWQSCCDHLAVPSEGCKAGVPEEDTSQCNASWEYELGFCDSEEDQCSEQCYVQCCVVIY